jgi:hypothetical protein
MKNPSTREDSGETGWQPKMHRIKAVTIRAIMILTEELARFWAAFALFCLLHT